MVEEGKGQVHAMTIAEWLREWEEKNLDKPVQDAIDAASRALKLAKESPWREVEMIAGAIAEYDEGALGLAVALESLRILAVKHGGDVNALAAELAKRQDEHDAAERQNKPDSPAQAVTEVLE